MEMEIEMMMEMYMDTYKKKSRIRETPTLSTEGDSRTNTNLKRLRE